jgi:mycothiol system anti-sigma-R factor
MSSDMTNDMTNDMTSDMTNVPSDDPCSAAGMDCQKVLADVYLYLDGQMAETDAVSLKAHLDDCSPCLKEFGLEEHVRILVARCCTAEVAPDDLKSKVMARIRVVTEVTVVETHSF